MIQIKINGEWVETYPGTSLKYVINSPAFSDKAIVGDFSYSLSFPDSDKNALTFGFISNPDLYNHTSQHSCELYEQNNLMVSGVFKVTKAIKGDKISGNFINSAFDFKEQIKDMTTKDLALSDITRHTGTVAEIVEASHSSGYPTYHFAHFPIFNEILMDGLHVETEEDWHNVPYLNDYLISPLTFRIDSLFPYLAYVIEELFSHFNLKLKNNLIAQHPELVKLCLINLYRKRRSPELHNLTDSIIKTSLENIITGINKAFGIVYFFNFRTREVEMTYLNSLPEQGDFDDWSSKLLPHTENSLENEEEGFEFKFENDSGDETMTTFQLPPGSLDDAVISEPITQPVHLPNYGTEMGQHAGEIREVISEQMYYIIVDISDDPKVPNYQWARLTWKFFGKKIEEGKKTISSIISTTGMVENDPGRVIWLTPYLNQVLFTKNGGGILSKIKPGETNAELIEPSIAEINPRILFFRGLRNNGWAEPYPLGTSSHFDTQGNSIGTLSLRWDGDDGLYSSFWEKWITFLQNTKTYKFKIKLDLLDILNLDLKKHKKINSNFYLVKKIEIDLPITKSATVTMARV